MKPAYKFKVPLYHHGYVHLFFNEDAFRGWVAKTHGEDFKVPEGIDGYSMQSEFKGTTHHILYTRPDCISTIYHECLHIGWWILDTHNVKIDTYNHEALTYLQGWLAEKVIACSEKYKKKEKELNGAKKKEL